MKHFLGLLLACLLMTMAEAATVTVTWSASTDAVGVAGYNVYRSTGGGASTKIGTSTTTTYTDTTAVAGTQYSYTVQAYDAKGNTSGFSIPATITTQAAADTTAPTIPSNVAAKEAGGTPPPSGSSIPFTALHTYFISPTGSDSNNGLTTTTAWLTPNHAGIVCGDVVIVAAGSYTNQFDNTFRAPASCPSTTGGIDGLGGIYFAILLCAGPDIESCQINGTKRAADIAISNWAVEGFVGTVSDVTSDRGCFMGIGEVAGVNNHHVAFINNIARRCGVAGFATGGYQSPPGAFDQAAVIGAIAFNTANSLTGYICGSGISIIPIAANSDPGTHVIIEQTFLWGNTNAPGSTECKVGNSTTYPHSDGEAIIFDTWGLFGGYPYPGVVRNNVMWRNGNGAFQAFPQYFGNDTPPSNDRAQMTILNNTSWGNFEDPRAGGGADFFLHQIYPNSGAKYVARDNIFVADKRRPGNVTDTVPTVSAVHVDCYSGGSPPGVQQCNNQAYVEIVGNYFWTSVAPATCGIAGTWTAYYNGGLGGGTWNWGANTYCDPGFTNTAALPTVATAPVCTGHVTAVDCALNKYGVYNAVKPTIAPLTTGYQPPGPCVASDPLYPTWLKGIVYLKASGFANGATITQNSGLMTKPCNL